MIDMTYLNTMPSIMIVDDEHENLDTISRVLSTDYEPLVYVSSSEALNDLVSGKTVPDLILLDIMMPEIDGYSFCQRIKKVPHSSDIPVIFTTALQNIEDEQRGFEAGAVDYIKKPFSTHILKARIKTHVELKRSRETLQHFCETDALTDIHNRYYFNMIYKREIRRVRRHHETIGLLMLDVDYFKKFNDTYGHIAGDECLRNIAKSICRACLRTTDFYARYGGEEFIVLLTKTNIKEILYLAEKIHKNVSEMKIPHKNSSVNDYVTVSIGCSILNGKDIENNDLIVIEQADQALYEAKKTRNSTFVFKNS